MWHFLHVIIYICFNVMCSKFGFFFSVMYGLWINTSWNVCSVYWIWRVSCHMCDWMDYKIKLKKNLPSKESLHSKRNVVITYDNKPCIILVPLSVRIETKC